MKNQRAKNNLIKIMAVAAVVVPTVLLQAQSSQAIPLDGILDSAGKAFVRGLFNLPPEQPEAPKEVTAVPDNSNVPDPASVSTETTDIIEQN
jgi:hypothetical protein